MSPEPQTPRQTVIESRSPSGPSTGLGSAALRNANSATFDRALGSARQATPTSSQSDRVLRSTSSQADRVLRSARQATPTSSQADRSLPRPQTPDFEDGLATRVINLLEGYNIQLSSKEKRKLRVVIDDYVDGMEMELSLCKEKLEDMQEADEDGYVVD